MSIFGKLAHSFSKSNSSSDNTDFDEYDEYEEDYDEEESLSVYDAAEIWASNGKDEDYMFGYSEEELEDAL